MQTRRSRSSFFVVLNWPTYRFYDLPDGPLGISFFIAASASGVSGTTGSFAAAVLPLEPPLPPDPKNCIAVSASPSIAPPPFPPPQVREAMEKPNQRVYGAQPSGRADQTRVEMASITRRTSCGSRVRSELCAANAIA